MDINMADNIRSRLNFSDEDMNWSLNSSKKGELRTDHK